jgi:hypothetical protein
LIRPETSNPQLILPLFLALNNKGKPLAACQGREGPFKSVSSLLA